MRDAFFLTGATAPLFCLHWRGDPALAPVLLLPPLLEELNKSRRQLNEMARALHASGRGVLLVDWTGTGDSGAELADVAWSHWQADVAQARAFLAEQYRATPILCALRGGALLLPEHPDCEWWLCAPLLDGQQQLTQWLRLKLMAARMAGDTLTSEQLLAQIAAGGVEIAGYWLAPGLVEPMRAVRVAEAFLQHHAPRHLIELSSSSTPSPALQPLLGSARVSWQAVVGDAFWQTTEISVCPALDAALVARAQAAGAR